MIVPEEKSKIFDIAFSSFGLYHEVLLDILHSFLLQEFFKKTQNGYLMHFFEITSLRILWKYWKALVLYNFYTIIFQY